MDRDPRAGPAFSTQRPVPPAQWHTEGPAAPMRRFPQAKLRPPAGPGGGRRAQCRRGAPLSAPKLACQPVTWALGLGAQLALDPNRAAVLGPRRAPGPGIGPPQSRRSARPPASRCSVGGGGATRRPLASSLTTQAAPPRRRRPSPAQVGMMPVARVTGPGPAGPAGRRPWVANDGPGWATAPAEKKARCNYRATAQPKSKGPTDSPSRSAGSS